MFFCFNLFVVATEYGHCLHFDTCLLALLLGRKMKEKEDGTQPPWAEKRYRLGRRTRVT